MTKTCSSSLGHVSEGQDRGVIAVTDLFCAFDNEVEMEGDESCESSSLVSLISHSVCCSTSCSTSSLSSSVTDTLSVDVVLPSVVRSIGKEITFSSLCRNAQSRRCRNKIVNFQLNIKNA